MASSELGDMEADGDAIPAAPEDLMQMNEAQASGGRGGEVHTVPAAFDFTLRSQYHNTSIYEVLVAASAAAAAANDGRVGVCTGTRKSIGVP